MKKYTEEEKKIIIEQIAENPAKYLKDSVLASLPGFMLEVVKRKVHALEYASEKLKSDKEFMLKALLIWSFDKYETKNYSSGLKYASEELKSDKEFMLAVAEFDKSSLEYASEKLKSDKEFMLAALKNDEYALKYASEELKSDKEFMLAALEYTYQVKDYASRKLKLDREFALELAKDHPALLRYEIPKTFALDKEFIKEVVKCNSLAIFFVREELESDKEFMSELDEIDKNSTQTPKKR